MNKSLTTVSSLIAIAIVLELIVKLVFPLLNMPFGGNFIGLSMIPLVLIGFLFGIKYGLMAGFIYGVIEILLAPSGYIIGWSFLLDYLFGFMAFGLTGLFHGQLSSVKSVVIGILFAGFIRYLSLSIAGVVFWSDAMNADAFIFSFFIYNPWYNLSTTLISLLVVLLIKNQLIQSLSV